MDSRDDLDPIIPMPQSATPSKVIRQSDGYSKTRGYNTEVGTRMSRKAQRAVIRERGDQRDYTEGSRKGREAVGKDQAKESVQGDITKMRLSVPDESTTNIIPLIFRYYILCSCWILVEESAASRIFHKPLEYLAARKGKSAAIPEEKRKVIEERDKWEKQKPVSMRAE
ncbi:hypothetical protein C8J56DRAFT_1174073 [Mycena floridula]|nr:hypothetical protein C8J56DRAFT_1174073 [Mycena floridula]